MKPIIFQFIFLQLILFIGLFSKGSREYLKKWSWLPVYKRHRVKAVLLMIAGILQVLIAWCFQDPGPNNNNIGAWVFLIGGLIWLVTGILFFIFGSKTKIKHAAVRK